MKPIPLFPLQVVLFPGAVMPLHIFEPRYQQMITDVMDGDRVFGLIYHDPDEHGPFLGEQGQVGCLARIREMQPLEEGRSLILIEGVGRFEIEAYHESEKLYYEALVRDYIDWEQSGPELELARDRAVESFLDLVEDAGGSKIDMPDIEKDREVSFQICARVQVMPQIQQDLLELRREVDRLQLLDRLFQAVIEADVIEQEPTGFDPDDLGRSTDDIFGIDPPDFGGDS